MRRACYLNLVLLDHDRVRLSVQRICRFRRLQARLEPRRNLTVLLLESEELHRGDASVDSWPLKHLLLRSLTLIIDGLLRGDLVESFDAPLLEVVRLAEQL